MTKEEIKQSVKMPVIPFTASAAASAVMCLNS